MLDIAFTVVTLPGDNLELFIDARVENPSYLSSHSAFRDSSYSTQRLIYHEGLCERQILVKQTQTLLLSWEEVSMTSTSMHHVVTMTSYPRLQMIELEMMFLLRILRWATKTPIRSIKQSSSNVQTGLHTVPMSCNIRERQL